MPVYPISILFVCRTEGDDGIGAFTWAATKHKSLQDGVERYSRGRVSPRTHVDVWELRSDALRGAWWTKIEEMTL